MAPFVARSSTYGLTRPSRILSFTKPASPTWAAYASEVGVIGPSGGGPGPRRPASEADASAPVMTGTSLPRNVGYGRPSLGGHSEPGDGGARERTAVTSTNRATGTCNQSNGCAGGRGGRRARKAALSAQGLGTPATTAACGRSASLGGLRGGEEGVLVAAGASACPACPSTSAPACSCSSILSTSDAFSPVASKPRAAAPPSSSTNAGRQRPHGGRPLPLLASP